MKLIHMNLWHFCGQKFMDGQRKMAHINSSFLSIRYSSHLLCKECC